jgi:hypothetical protein
MGLQPSKFFFFQIQIRWIYASQTYEFHYNFATGSATSCKLPLVAAWTMHVWFHVSLVRRRRHWILTGPPWGSNNVGFFLPSILISRASSAVDSLCRWNWLYYKWTQWAAVRLEGRLRKRAQSVSEYDTHKKPCFLWGQILLVFNQNIWDNFLIFLFSSENSSSYVCLGGGYFEKNLIYI